MRSDAAAGAPGQRPRRRVPASTAKRASAKALHDRQDLHARPAGRGPARQGGAALASSTGAIAGTRYVYVFDAGNANAYAAFVCLDGRVTSVERYMPGR